MTNRELMRQALSAFEAILFEKNIEATQIIARNARYSLREALAQPEQEPKLTDAGADTNISRGLEPKGSGMVTLNQVGMRVDLKDGTRKPWVGLTDEEINSLYPTNWFEFARLIEAKLKEKNHGSV